MAIKILVISLLYLSFSFILTALFVRFRGKDPLAGFYRKHFGCFPSFPVVAVAQICLLALALLAGCARVMFELLSGKPTYHRRKVNYYGQRQKPRSPQFRLDRALKMDSSKAVDSSPRPGLVNDNEAMFSNVSKAASKY